MKTKPREDISPTPISSSARWLALAAPLLLLVGISACSGSSKPPVTDEEPSNEEQVQVTTVESKPSEDSNPAGENTPIGLLLAEIQIISKAALLQVQIKLNNGQSLNSSESNCLRGFDGNLGLPLSSINCENSLSVNNRLLHVSSTSLRMDPACEADLLNGTVSRCVMDSAEMGFDLEWVDSSRIATLLPIPGTNIGYNTGGDGRLLLTSTTDLTGTFRCPISISTASQLAENAIGNCREEISRTLNRLYQLRTRQ